jgi:hypothetical protein
MYASTRMADQSDRDLGFQIRFRVVDGSLAFKGSQVGTITRAGHVPVRAFYRRYPPPGGYRSTYSRFIGALPEELILETWAPRCQFGGKAARPSPDVEGDPRRTP